MEHPNLESPEIKGVVSEARDLVTLADAYCIDTNDQYELAASDLGRIKTAQKKVEAMRKKITVPMDEAKQAVMDFFRGPAASLDHAERVLKEAMGSFQYAQRRLAREAQEKADAAAEAERKRLERQAEKAAEGGKEARAQTLSDRAAAVVAPVVQIAVPKVAGISAREIWKFYVTDPALIPREFLMVDEKKIGRVVRTMKSDTKIPGIRIFANSITAVAAQ